MDKHYWYPDIKDSIPILRCNHKDCSAIWYPDRLEPKSNCPQNTKRGKRNGK